MFGSKKRDLSKSKKPVGLPKPYAIFLVYLSELLKIFPVKNLKVNYSNRSKLV